jgi:hypothetical protein
VKICRDRLKDRMISIACTNCRTVLTIDDAFAGGVCRCQHCGTIQTVPSHLKSNSRAPAPESPPGSKTLYKHRASADAGTGLDELASIVASSGLASSRLRTATATATAPQRNAAPGKRRGPILLIISGIVVLLALVVFGIIYLMRGSAAAPTADTSAAPPSTVTDNSGNPAPPAADTVANKLSGPSFCGVPLIENNVVYVLDRGSATDQYFDGLKAALYRSLELIGPDHKFAVILTDNGTPDFSYPTSGLANATPDQIKKVRNIMDDLISSGASKLRPALKKAADRHPDIIIVVTAKWTIDPDDAEALKQYAQRGIRMHTFMLGSSDAVDALQQAASLSGGIFSRVSDNQLKDFGS